MNLILLLINQGFRNNNYFTSYGSKSSTITGMYIKKRDEKSSKRGVMVNKLQPIRAYARYNEEFKSNKRSALFSNERGIMSPYAATRENTTNTAMNKIRENKIIKSTENDIQSDQSDAYKDQPQIIQKQPQVGLSKIRIMNGAIMNQLNQNRWKSTLHSRGQNAAFYRHK